MISTRSLGDLLDPRTPTRSPGDLLDPKTPSFSFTIRKIDSVVGLPTPEGRRP